MDASVWQTTLPSVKERNFYALNNSLFCDVEFSVVDLDGDKVNIPVHKYVLAISSPVFQAMFYGRLAETRQIIELQDCTKEGLEELLHYIYTDEVNLNENNVMEVMLLADKYMLPFLVERCCQYLKEKLKPEDVFNVLPQAQKLVNKKAFYLCWDIIDNHTQRAVASQPFLNISREVLCQVLDRQHLHVEEVELFRAADRWASSQIKKKDPEAEVGGGKKRIELGDEAVQLIRFPVMSHKEFASYVLPSDILLKSEIVEVMQAISGVMPRPATFRYERRIGQRWERWSEVRFFDDDHQDTGDLFGMTTRGSVYRTIIRSGAASIDLLVNRRVSLAGIRLIGSYNQQYHVNLKLFQTNQPDSILYQSNKSYTTGEDLIDGFYPGYTVMINPPLQFEPDVRYTIDAGINGPPYPRRGRVGKTTITCGDVIISLLTSDYDTSEYGDTVNNGQFPAFLLKWD